MQTGDLTAAADYAFAFRTLDPRPDPPRALVLLLHGVGGDEEQLASLGARIGQDALVVLPRGPRSISGGRLGWYRVGLGADGPQVVEEEAEEARCKLIDFIEQLQGHFDVGPERTYLAGFSQGGILASSAALTAPHLAAGFAVACGRLLPEIEPITAAPGALAHLQALVLHGRADETLAVGWADSARERLHHLGIAHDVRLYDAGHELTPAMEEDLLAWLGSRLAG